MTKKRHLFSIMYNSHFILIHSNSISDKESLIQVSSMQCIII